MNARSYRVNVKLSPLDFPAIMGLGESSVVYQSEPHIINNDLVLTIAKTYVLHDMSTNKRHAVLTVQSVYKIPPNEIKRREHIYQFYNDANQGLNEAYQYARTQMPSLPHISFSNQPIENYQSEIDRIFNLLNSRN